MKASAVQDAKAMPENHRQKEENFIKALSNMRVNNLNNDDVISKDNLVLL